MDQNQSPVERAFELARSGRYANVSDIKRQLSKEGYSITQIEGPMLLKQLRTAMADTRPKAT